MIVYKTETGNVAGWHTSVKNGKLEYFNKGWKKTKVFEQIGEVDYAETWGEVVSINNRFGFEVALETAEYLTAGVVKWAYTMAYIDIANKLEGAGFGMDVFEKCISICRPDYWLALCGTGSFDVVDLDNRLHTPDGISLADHLTANFGKLVSAAIKAGI